MSAAPRAARLNFLTFPAVKMIAAPVVALREIAERARPALTRAGAALDLDVPAELRARFDRDALARIVGNLLDMTRLDAGVIVPKREAVEVGDLISTTLRRAAPVLKDRVVVSTVAPDLPTLQELLGRQNVKNYDGSWTEYGSLIGVPIALGDEPGKA